MDQLTTFTILLILFNCTHPGNARSQDVSLHVENLIESVTDNLNEEEQTALIIEDLQEYAGHPLNINTATSQQLRKLHLLDDIQIRKLLDYLRKYGPAYSVYELNTIDGFHPELLKRVAPFIYFGPLEAEFLQLKKNRVQGRHEWLVRATATIQKPEGYKKREDGSVPFAGDRSRLYSRYKFSAGDNISAGFTAEKDPGEPFFRGVNKNGFDFYSGYISMKVSPAIEQLTLGDFVVRSGQGLALWQGFSTGKSVAATHLSKTSQGVRPYTSANENAFFRGISTSLKWQKMRIHLFCSKKRYDANLVSDSSGRHFTSLQTSGYHRTAGETKDKNSVSGFDAGTAGTWQSGNLKVGYTFLFRQFEIPFIRSDQLYNHFRFQGKRNFVAGIDYLFSKGNIRLFGEGAQSASGGKAVLQGFSVHLHDRIQTCGMFRHFDRDYNAMLAAPFSEGSAASNETGFYLGAHILPFKYVTLSAYTDHFRSEWINFTTAGPSSGWEFASQAEIRPSKKTEVLIRFKNDVKEKKTRVMEKHENCLEQFKKFRLHLCYAPLHILTLKTRAEYVHYKNQTSEKGWMVFQDIRLTPFRERIRVDLRAAWFQTDSYNSRIYAYENDLLYSFSIPAFFGKGVRTYINLKYKISDHAEIWFKLANTSCFNVESIGSGYNEISGDRKTDVKFQFRLKM